MKNNQDEGGVINKNSHLIKLVDKILSWLNPVTGTILTLISLWGIVFGSFWKVITTLVIILILAILYLGFDERGEFSVGLIKRKILTWFKDGWFLFETTDYIVLFRFLKNIFALLLLMALGAFLTPGLFDVIISSLKLVLYTTRDIFSLALFSRFTPESRYLQSIGLALLFLLAVSFTHLFIFWRQINTMRNAQYYEEYFRIFLENEIIIKWFTFLDWMRSQDKDISEFYNMSSSDRVYGMASQNRIDDGTLKIIFENDLNAINCSASSIESISYLVRRKKRTLVIGISSRDARDSLNSNALFIRSALNKYISDEILKVRVEGYKSNLLEEVEFVPVKKNHRKIVI